VLRADAFAGVSSGVVTAREYGSFFAPSAPLVSARITSLLRWLGGATVALVALAGNAWGESLDAVAHRPATQVELAPAEDGSLGAWLLLGPYPSSTHEEKTPSGSALDALPPALHDVDESTLGPGAGGLQWTLASASEGPIDVKAALHARGTDLIAYAAGTVHIERAGRYLLLIGADDGLGVFVDGVRVFARDESRPQRDDDDLVPLDLAPGDHRLLLKLHQRDSGWAFKVRLLDARLSAPEGGYLALPGTTADDARVLAQKLSWVSVDRGLLATADGYRPKLTVRFPEGAPRGVPLRTTVQLVGNRDKAVHFDVDAGEVPLDARGVGDLCVTLPVVAASDDTDLTYEVSVAGRVVKAAFSPRARIRNAVAHASRALAALPADAPWLLTGSRDSVVYLEGRLATFASHSDGDLEAQQADATELDALASDLDQKVDPYARRTGAMRRALVAPFDGKPAPFGLYVPKSFRPGEVRRFPIIVALHGLNGRPMAMIRYLFGNDDPARENEWEDRHVGPLPPLDAFVITPSGYGNTMYRDLGEEDVLRVLGWALSRYPIDPARVTITGMSMGGIGAASIPLHHPGIFAAAEPLCGYHSYFVRRDIAGHPLRPWEHLLAEERSNALWALNGQHLPLYIVHGTLDLPEENSGVLIKRYEELGYDVVHEHPPLGHNVWQTTYEDLKGAHWLLEHTREPHPNDVRFRTLRLRDGDDAWVHVDELTAPDSWGEVDARAVARGSLVVKTTDVAALHLDRESALGTAHAKVTLRIDGTTLSFDDDEPITLHRDPSAGPQTTWLAGPAKHEGLFKHGGLTGPIRDAFHEPLLFVYGASDPAETRANEEVARQWAAIRWGVSADYPVISDVEFFARGESLANARALFLVGSARTNAVVRALDARLPIHIDGDAVVVGSQRYTGRELGAAFIRPNPERPDRYVVVVEGTSALGTWRSLSLPDLIPDFVVYDASIAPSRGQMILGSGSVQAAGFFTNSWELPTVLADPLVHTARPAAKSEYEATPYLP
jgi:predicted esterase